MLKQSNFYKLLVIVWRFFNIEVVEVLDVLVIFVFRFEDLSQFIRVVSIFIFLLYCLQLRYGISFDVYKQMNGFLKIWYKYKWNFFVKNEIIVYIRKVDKIG